MSHNLGDSTDNDINVFLYLMPPHTDGKPADGHQLFVDFPISCNVGFNFFLPELSIGLRLGMMFWATVPETAIHKNGDPCTFEYDIRFAEQPGLQMIT